MNTAVANGFAGDFRYQPHIEEYQNGTPRAKIFQSLILQDLKTVENPVVMDIGCGKGLDGAADLARVVANRSKSYIGIEPDTSIPWPTYITTLHRTTLERAAIKESSVDVAFCAMVLEHVSDPATFMNRVHEVLKDGGVFWGFTVDARHWFPAISSLFDKIKIKEHYLHLLHGKRGEERYENYPVFYRLNTPEAVEKHVSRFSERTYLNLYRPNQLNFYMPSPLRSFGSALNGVSHAVGFPGTILCVRLQK